MIMSPQQLHGPRKMSNQNSTQDDFLLGRTLIDDTVRTAERDMVLPVLLAAAKAYQLGLDGLTSGQLYRAIEPLVSLSPQDMAPGRSDRKNVSALLHTFRNAFSHELFDGLLVEVKFEQAGRQQEGYRITEKGVESLLKGLLSESPDLRTGDVMTVVPGQSRILEDMVSRQILFRLSELQPNSSARAVSTSNLRKDVRAELPLSLMDIQILNNRKDTHFDQVFRNSLRAIRPLMNYGLIERTELGYKITDKGRLIVLDMIMEKVSTPNFGVAPNPRLAFQAEVDSTLTKHATKVEARRSALRGPR